VFISFPIENNSYSYLRGKLLHKLFLKRCWGGKHTAFDNLYKGFKPNQKNDVKKIAEQLIKENFLLQKKAFYGLHIYLNPKFAQEIKEEINIFLERIEKEK
jgi:hypothetical protein